MLNPSDVRDDDIMQQFDEVRQELQRIAEKRKINLGLIRISNKEAEKYNKRYMSFNYN